MIPRGRVRFIQTTAALLAVSFAMVSHAVGVVRIASGEWIPYNGKDLNEQGFCSHIVTEAFKASGYDVEFEYYPWKRSFHLVEEGTFDATLCWVETEERKGPFLISEPILTEKVFFFHRRDMDFEWNTIDDLAKFKIGGTIGYSYGEPFENAVKENRIQVDRVSKDELNFRKLLRGRIDIYPIEFIVGYSIIANTFKPAQALLLTNHPKPLRVTKYHLLVSRALPGDRPEKLLEAFNRGLQSLHESGKYDEMSDLLFEGYYNPQQ